MVFYTNLPNRQKSYNIRLILAAKATDNVRNIINLSDLDLGATAPETRIRGAKKMKKGINAKQMNAIREESLFIAKKQSRIATPNVT